MDYYHIFLAWLRMLNIREKNQEELSLMEARIIEATRDIEHTVLEPISIFLRDLSNITTGTGQHLYPTFPPLPVTLVNDQPGYFGPITEENPTLYEEIPCLGVMAETVRQTVLQAHNGPYTSSLTTDNKIANAILWIVLANLWTGSTEKIVFYFLQKILHIS